MNSINQESKIENNNPVEESFSQQEWAETPHEAKVKIKLNEIAELGDEEAAIWKKLNQAGMLEPSSGMKSLDGKFSNLSAMISDTGEDKNFIVTGVCKGNSYERVILNYYDIYEAIKVGLKQELLKTNKSVLKTLAKAEHFYTWVNRHMHKNAGSYEEFVRELWKSSDSLPVRVSHQVISLKTIMANILLHISAEDECYYHYKEGCILLRRKDLQAVANELGIKVCRIINELNNAHLLLETELSGSYQHRLRIGKTSFNYYVIRI